MHFSSSQGQKCHLMAGNLWQSLIDLLLSSCAFIRTNLHPPPLTSQNPSRPFLSYPLHDFFLIHDIAHSSRYLRPLRSCIVFFQSSHLLCW